MPEDSVFVNYSNSQTRLVRSITIFLSPPQRGGIGAIQIMTDNPCLWRNAGKYVGDGTLLNSVISIKMKSTDNPVFQFQFYHPPTISCQDTRISTNLKTHV